MAEKNEEGIKRAQLTRIYEANAGISSPTDLDIRARAALTLAIWGEFGLPNPPTVAPSRPLSRPKQPGT
jgi:hypothetical protein